MLFRGQSQRHTLSALCVINGLNVDEEDTQPPAGNHTPPPT